MEVDEIKKNFHTPPHIHQNKRLTGYKNFAWTNWLEENLLLHVQIYCLIKRVIASELHRGARRTREGEKRDLNLLYLTFVHTHQEFK